MQLWRETWNAVKEVFGDHPLPGDVPAAAPRSAAKATGPQTSLIKGSLLAICVKKLQHLLQKLHPDKIANIVSVDEV